MDTLNLFHEDLSMAIVLSDYKSQLSGPFSRKIKCLNQLECGQN